MMTTDQVLQFMREHLSYGPHSWPCIICVLWVRIQKLEHDED